MDDKIVAIHISKTGYQYEILPEEIFKDSEGTVQFRDQYDKRKYYLTLEECLEDVKKFLSKIEETRTELDMWV